MVKSNICRSVELCVSEVTERVYLPHTKNCAIVDGCKKGRERNNYEFKVGNKKRSDNRTLENARHIFDDVR